MILQTINNIHLQRIKPQADSRPMVAQTVLEVFLFSMLISFIIVAAIFQILTKLTKKYGKLISEE